MSDHSGVGKIAVFFRKWALAYSVFIFGGWVLYVLDIKGLRVTGVKLRDSIGL